jgi:hypothetical protein
MQTSFSNGKLATDGNLGALQVTSYKANGATAGLVLMLLV